MGEDVLESLDDPERCPVDEAARAALRFAETMTREPAAVGESGIESLRKHYTEEQIVELACVVGLFNYLNRFAEALGVWPTRPGEGGPDDPATD